MDHLGIGLAVCNGEYSHSNIALAMRVLEILGVELDTILDVEAKLYALRPASITEEA